MNAAQRHDNRRLLGKLCVFVIVMFGMTEARILLGKRGIPTARMEALEWLCSATLLVIGFAEWQTSRRARFAMRGLAAAYVLFWFALELSSKRTAPFHPVLGPVHAMAIVGAAGLTLIARVRSTYERWTGQFWFWACAGFMLIFGTEVVLDPLLDFTYASRQDLSDAAFSFHQGVTVVGYLLIARSLWHTKAPAGLE